MAAEFIKAIKEHQSAFGLGLTDEQITRLADYYELILEHNEFLHLVAPMSPEEFAIRHILESLTLLEYLPMSAKLADVGAGAGLPSIPCLLVRDGLKAILIESKEKKAKFLDFAIESLGLTTRVKIVHNQFEEAELGDCEYVTCRALDKFTEKLPRLLKWSRKRYLLFFGGKNLSLALQKQGVLFDQKLMPMSEQRFLFISQR
ncbi:MAG: 16S rRNA (guanine(527)-N(7))-methyltransferase RsmG [Chloracidobacterium sp.]|nr:16S rRNA (guanine(527)-N(7))-methyltransferase RsmG [Chloracidobacterium sp.]